MIQTGGDGFDQFSYGAAFSLEAAAVSGAREAGLDFLDPVAQLEQETLNISDDYFVFGSNSVNLLPAIDQAGKRRGQLARLPREVEHIHLEPRILKIGLANEHRPGVDQTRDYG